MFMAYAVRKKCHAGIISRNGLRKLIGIPSRRISVQSSVSSGCSALYSANDSVIIWKKAGETNMNLKKASLKQKLVLIIGIACYVVILCRHIETLLYHAPRPYVISTFIQGR